MVLRGAISQWKRSAGGSAATGPPVAARRRRWRRRSPGGARRAATSSIRRQRQQPRRVELDARVQVAALAREEDHADVEALAPLDARHDADDRVAIPHGGCQAGGASGVCGPRRWASIASCSQARGPFSRSRR